MAYLITFPKHARVGGLVNDLNDERARERSRLMDHRRRHDDDRDYRVFTNTGPDGLRRPRRETTLLPVYLHIIPIPRYSYIAL